MTKLLYTTALLSCLPVLAAAQDVACQGLDDSSWIAGAQDASDVATAAEALEANSFVPLGGFSNTRFTLSQDAMVRYEVRGSFGGDPIAYLYNESGEQVDMNDDGAVDYGVLSEVSLPAGNYCLAVQNVENGLLPVDIRIGRTEHEPMQQSVADVAPGMGCFELDDLEEVDVSAPFTREFEIFGQAGVTFTLTEPMSLTLNAIGQGNDPLLSLESEDTGLVDENDDMVGLDARLDMADPLPAGRYCVGVDTYEQNGSGVTLEIKPLDLEELKVQRINAGEISPLPGSGHPITDLGTLNGRIIRDVEIGADFTWFSISVDSESMILVESMVVNDSDPTSVLFDEVGRELDRNDDFGTDYGSRVLSPVSAGTYLLGIGSVNETTEQTRVIIDQYVRVR